MCDVVAIGITMVMGTVTTYRRAFKKLCKIKVARQTFLILQVHNGECKWEKCDVST